MARSTRSRWLRPACRVVCALALVSTLAGCVVAPYPVYRPHYYYRY
jgi:hypothetical protein